MQVKGVQTILLQVFQWGQFTKELIAQGAVSLL